MTDTHPGPGASLTLEFFGENTPPHLNGPATEGAFSQALLHRIAVDRDLAEAVEKKKRPKRGRPAARVPLEKRKQIRELLAQGLTQVAIGNIVDVAPSTISKLKNGKAYGGDE